MSAKRTIIFGDVHGCATEFKELLELTGARPEDDLVSVGDLICKGPDDLGVMRLAMSLPNLRCVMGNHELRLLNQWRGVPSAVVKSYDHETIAQLGSERDRCMRYIERFPYFIEEREFLVVHAGVDARRTSLAAQSEHDLTHVRELLDLKRPWFESYTDPRLIVFGHWAAKGLIVRPNAIGLDTGCVYGGSLSAVILPERKIVSVPARKVYHQKHPKQGQTT